MAKAVTGGSFSPLLSPSHADSVLPLLLPSSLVPLPYFCGHSKVFFFFCASLLNVKRRQGSTV